MALRALTVAALALVFVTAACGSDDTNDTTNTTGSASNSGSGSTFTEAELREFGVATVDAIAAGDRQELVRLVSDIVPQERIDELVACKPDDLTVDRVDVVVNVNPPTMRIEGTVDVSQSGETATRVVLWTTELSETSDGEYVMSSLPSGCPFIFQ